LDCNYQWGSRVYDLGVDTLQDAYEIWSIHKGTPLNEREREYIRTGFEKELEKE
jgi:hypothetical protein